MFRGGDYVDNQEFTSHMPQRNYMDVTDITGAVPKRRFDTRNKNLGSAGRQIITDNTRMVAAGAKKIIKESGVGDLFSGPSTFERAGLNQKSTKLVSQRHGSLPPPRQMEKVDSLGGPAYEKQKMTYAQSSLKAEDLRLMEEQKKMDELLKDYQKSQVSAQQQPSKPEDDALQNEIDRLKQENDELDHYIEWKKKQEQTAPEQLIADHGHAQAQRQEFVQEAPSQRMPSNYAPSQQAQQMPPRALPPRPPKNDENLISNPYGYSASLSNKYVKYPDHGKQLPPKPFRPKQAALGGASIIQDPSLMEFNVFKGQADRKHSTLAQRKVEDDFSKPMAERSPSTVDQLYFRGGSQKTIPVARSQNSQNSANRLFGVDVTNVSPKKKAGKRHFQPAFSEQNLLGVLH